MAKKTILKNWGSKFPSMSKNVVSKTDAMDGISNLLYNLKSR